MLIGVALYRASPGDGERVGGLDAEAVAIVVLAGGAISFLTRLAPKPTRPRPRSITSVSNRLCRPVCRLVRESTRCHRCLLQTRRSADKPRSWAVALAKPSRQPNPRRPARLLPRVRDSAGPLPRRARHADQGQRLRGFSAGRCTRRARGAYTASRACASRCHQELPLSRHFPSRRPDSNRGPLHYE